MSGKKRIDYFHNIKIEVDKQYIYIISENWDKCTEVVELSPLAVGNGYRFWSR